MASGKQKQSEEKSDDQLDNEDFVMAQTGKIGALQEKLDVCLTKRKAVGAVPKLHESESDSDEAHEDDDDVEDDADAARYHKAANAASRSTASKRCKIDASNQVEGKRVRVPTKAAPAAVATQRSQRALDEDEVYRACCGMRVSLRKGWQKTPDEVELDSKLGAIITAIELMYTWDERVFAEADRLRREAERWWLYSDFEYEDLVKVSFQGSEFRTPIVHESLLMYVVKMPDFGDDNMPMGLRPKIIAAYPDNLGPFASRNEVEPIPNCFTILKLDTRWTVKPLVESVEEPAVKEEECPPPDEDSDEGSEEGSEDPEEDEADDSEDSEDEDAEDADEEVSPDTSLSEALPPATSSSDEESDDDVPLSVMKAEQEAVAQFLVEFRAGQKRKAEAQLPSGSGKKAM
jgi:hypothetical protein